MLTLRHPLLLILALAETFVIVSMCKNTEECVPTRDCPSAVDAIDNKQMHHGYAGCGWVEMEMLICCPKNVASFELAHDRWTAEKACNNFTRSRPGILDVLMPERKRVVPGELPHVAALGLFENGSWIWSLCEGSLISFDYVLTAAHCIVSPYYEISMVRLGKLDLTGDSDNLTSQDINVRSTYIHPEYSITKKHNDIALLHLERPVIISPYVMPACLYVDGKDPTGYAITSSGWSFDRRGKPSDVLMKTKLKFIATATCNEGYSTGPFPRRIIPSQICAVSSDDGDAACLSNSGAPADVRIGDSIFVVGVNSYGSCGVRPDVYTKVASYIDWIEAIVWP